MVYIAIDLIELFAIDYIVQYWFYIMHVWLQITNDPIVSPGELSSLLPVSQFFCQQKELKIAQNTLQQNIRERKWKRKNYEGLLKMGLELAKWTTQIS